MMPTNPTRNAIATILLASCLAACGGGGGGSSHPEPIPAPPPAPPPPPPPPPPPAQAHFGLTETTELATTSDSIRFRWNAELDAYEIMFADGGWEKLTPGQNSELVAGGNYIYLDFVDGDYDYSSIAGIFPQEGGNPTYLGFGVPTASGDVPITGNASYAAELRGSSDTGYGIGGTAKLDFNFGAGTLSGEMNPLAYDGWGTEFVLGTYAFTNTVYSAGSTNYSGQFLWNGATVGDFQGRFTGPGAAELIGAFNAPFVDPYFPDSVDTMHGAWVGKKAK